MSRSHSKIISRTNHLLGKVLSPTLEPLVGQLTDQGWQQAVKSSSKIASLRHEFTRLCLNFLDPNNLPTPLELRKDIPSVDHQLARWEELVKGLPLMKLDIRTYPNPYNEPILLVPFMADVREAAWRAIEWWYVREREERPNNDITLLFRWLELGHLVGMSQAHWRDGKYKTSLVLGAPGSWSTLAQCPAQEFSQRAWENLEAGESSPDTFRFHAVPIVKSMHDDELFEASLLGLSIMNEGRTLAAILGITGVKNRTHFWATTGSVVIHKEDRYFSSVNRGKIGSTEISLQMMNKKVDNLLLCRLPIA